MGYTGKTTSVHLIGTDGGNVVSWKQPLNLPESNEMESILQNVRHWKTESFWVEYLVMGPERRQTPQKGEETELPG